MPSLRTASLIAILTALLSAAACGGPVEPSSPVAPPVATTTAPQPGSSAEEACGEVAPSGVTVEDAVVTTADGVALNAAVTGSGRQGVVLLHQTNQGLCGWLPYAIQLAGQGFHVLAFDFRCTFGSSCPEGRDDNGPDVIADVTAAVETLEERGATEVALVGASYGGAVAIGACTQVAVDRCAALSPALFDNKLGGGVTANTAIPELRRPLLFAVAPDDSSSPIEAGRALVRRAPRKTVTFVELPSNAGHGWDTVADPADLTQPSPFAAQLEDFLRG